MSGFSKMHPITQLAFFVASIVIIMSVSNPYFSVLALVSVLIYSLKKSVKSFLFDLKMTVIFVFTVGIFNMLFAHYGVDVLFKINEVEFTLESLFYGVNQGIVLSVAVIQFAEFSKVFDSERIIYIFKFAPKFALMFSMILGFIPRFKTKLNDINQAQSALNGGKKTDADLKQKMLNSINTFSALVTYSLESSVITANSMRARNYNPKAIRYGRFKWKKDDVLALILITVSFFTVIFLMFNNKFNFIFEPVIYSESNSVLGLVLFALLENLPLFVDLTEDFLWKKSYAKI